MSKKRSETDYERSDVPPGLVAVLAGGLAVTVAAILLGVRLAYGAGPDPTGPLQPLPPEPRLQTAPRQQRASYQREESNKLANIDSAMNEVAKSGWGSTK